MSDEPEIQADNRPKGAFVKGDPRINRKGRPRTFDALRKQAVKIAGEVISSPDGRLSISRVNAILLDWATSKDVRKQQLFMEYAFGKTVDKKEISGPDGKAIEIQASDYRAAIAALAPRSVDDSDAPSPG